MRTYNPHRIPPPKNFQEAIEEIIRDGGSEARVIVIDAYRRTLRLDGSYPDVLLARKALSDANVLISL